MTYLATARTETDELTAQGDTPERAAWILAQKLSQMGNPMDTEIYHRLLKRGFVHLGYREDGRETFYAVDNVIEKSG